MHIILFDTKIIVGVGGFLGKGSNWPFLHLMNQSVFAWNTYLGFMLYSEFNQSSTINKKMGC